MEQSLEGNTSHFTGRTGLLFSLFTSACPKSPQCLAISPLPSFCPTLSPCLTSLSKADNPVFEHPCLHHRSCQQPLPPAHLTLSAKMLILKIALLPRASQGPGEARRDWQHLWFEPWPIPGAFSLQTDSPKRYHQRTLLFWQKDKFPSL